MNFLDTAKDSTFAGFNRYMVECEYIITELASGFIQVLIDTWWNVNIYNYDSNIRRTSFNRYMVECELRIQYY